MLQEWGPKQHVLELSENIRSGEDLWWNQVLEQCRRGELSPENYDWIHGYPAGIGISKAPLKFWYQHRRASQPACTDEECNDSCGACSAEKRRRNRLLPSIVKRDCTDEGLPATMPPDYNEAILITPHNQAVFHYSLKCAREFAKRNGRQLMWCPPCDAAEDWFVAGYTKEEMAKKQVQWLSYNARKTEGIPSLGPVCYDLPVRVTRGNGADMKQYGIHNGARGRIKDWTLHPDDLDRVAQSQESEIILTQLPTRIVLEMETQMSQKHPEYPEQHFPLTPVTNYWNLGSWGGSEAVEIRRRGYGMVPNFSTTIDGATGRTIAKGIGDLGNWSDLATPTRAMKGYIALSRVKCADDMLLAQPFSPCLFRQGKQHWPSLLLDVQTGRIPVDADFAQLCRDTDILAKQGMRLIDAQFHCCGCKEPCPLQHFLPNQHDNTRWYEDVERYVLRPGGAARKCYEDTWKCERCGKEKAKSDFSQSMWHHRKEQRAICLACQASSIVNAWKCQRCDQARTAEHFSTSMWHHRKDRKAICLACQPPLLEQTWECCLCGEAKSSQHYFKDPWTHRKVRCDTKCIDCSNPVCKAPGCKTCPKCRTAHRANKKCDAVVVSLPPRLVPSTLEQVRSWVCPACKPNVCVNWPQCRKALPAKKRQSSGTYECGECQTVKFGQQQRRAHA